jgi:hypothetical protein
MTFLIQFIRFRRGVREVIRTLPVEAVDAGAALARVRSRVGTSTWPMNTDALHVMDDGGRTVLDWIVLAPAVQQFLSLPPSAQRAQIDGGPLPASQPTSDNLTDAVGPPLTDHPHLEVGQAISFAEDGKPEIGRAATRSSTRIIPPQARRSTRSEVRTRRMIGS